MNGGQAVNQVIPLHCCTHHASSVFSCLIARANDRPVPSAPVLNVVAGYAGKLTGDTSDMEAA